MNNSNLKKNGLVLFWDKPCFLSVDYRRRPSSLMIALYLSMSTFWR